MLRRQLKPEGGPRPRRTSDRTGHRSPPGRRHRRLLAEPLEPRAMLALVPQLLADINPTPATVQMIQNDPGAIVDVGGVAYFTGLGSIGTGYELFKSDGTAQGTMLVKDIYPGGLNRSNIANLTNVGGTLLFTANDGTHGNELWKSDGTAAGTVLVKDITTGPISSSLSGFTPVGGTLFFVTNDGTNGAELWKSDGSEAGTVVVRDIAPGPASSSPASLTNVNGTLFFSASDGTSGVELWKSDGTAAGTVSSDIFPGTGSSNPIGLANINGVLLFRANDGSHGDELWKYDSAFGGPILVKDIQPGPSGSNLGTLINVNGTLFFNANDGTNGLELWKSDGSTAGTVPTNSSWIGSSVTVVGNTIYYLRNGTSSSLWKSDGTPAGTGPVDPLLIITSMANVNGTLFYGIDIGTNNISSHGDQLRKSDPSTFDANVVREILRGGPWNNVPRSLSNVGGKLFFSASDETAKMVLWTSDGTTAGTHPVPRGDMLTGSSSPAGITMVGNTAYFLADDGVHGSELWRTDGTPAGTLLVKDITAGAGSPAIRNLTNVNGTLFFIGASGTSSTRVLWKSDGTEQGTTVVAGAPASPQSLQNVNGSLFILASNAAWKSDGTAAGTVRLADWGFTSPVAAASAGGLFYYVSAGSDGAYQLWRSDGTPAGTFLLADGLSSSLINLSFRPVAVGSTVFFAAGDTQGGMELWKTDGTAAGTALVKDINPGSSGSYPTNLIDLNGTLYFAANGGLNGGGLWKSDGTEEGTSLVKDINPGAIGSGAGYITNVDGRLFFSANDGVAGTELWTSDGTPAGTALLQDIYPGASGSRPLFLANLNGTLYFSANDGVHGNELWQSDGTVAGTHQLPELVPGPTSSYLTTIVPFRASLLMIANDGLHGNELWTLVDSNHAPVAANDSLATNEGQPLTIQPADLLTNDADADNDLLSVVIATQPAHGSLTSEPDGSFVYTPAPHYSGPDHFTYQANDGDSLSAPATVSLVVNFVPDGTVSPRMLVDINQDPVGISLPSFNGIQPRSAGGLLYFNYDDGEHGLELWRTDGTGGGTSIVKDFTPGPSATNAFVLGELNGQVLLEASDGVLGREFWTTDGTPAGTRLLKDIWPGSSGSAPGGGLNVNGTFFFRANDGVHGDELWKTDGTADGTVLVKDIVSGSDDSDVRYFANVGGTLFFFNGAALWKSDGTEAGTVLVTTVDPRLTGPSGGTYLAAVDGTLYFRAYDATHGVELWKSDGTAAGTGVVQDINPGPADSSPRSLVNFNGRLYFQAFEPATGAELWKTDGSPAGTGLVTDLRPGSNGSGPSYLTVIGQSVFFRAFGDSVGSELWKTDGTAAGTVLVKDIQPGPGHGEPFQLTNVAGTLFFVANDGTHGYDLWKSDGTDAGTILVKDVLPGNSNYAFPDQLTNAGGTLFFRDKGSTSGLSVWKSDGTAAGTIEVPRDTVSTQDAFPSRLDAVSVGTELYVVTDDGELWKTDGTPAGSALIATVPFARYLTNVNGTVFFAAQGPSLGMELWKTDGTATGTVMVRDIRPGTGGSNPRSLANINSSLVFTANDGSGYQLWRSDGTEAGTLEFSGLYVRGNFSNARPFTEMNGELYFSGNDGTHGYELWKTDGTVAGTLMVADTLPGTKSSGAAPLANVGGTLFFSASDGTATHLWKTDGTAAGTVLVAPVTPAGSDRGSLGMYLPPVAANVSGVLFFRGFDADHGDELWRSDGTAAGTTLVKDIRPGSQKSAPEEFHNVNGVLMFLANDGHNGVQLWRSDGTAAGTFPYDLAAGWSFITAGQDASLFVVNNRLYFSANDGVNGYELWQTDGIQAAERIDIRPGPKSSGPKSVYPWNGNLVFTATDGIHGYELWSLVDINGAPSGTSTTVTTLESTAYTFTEADFGFGDPMDAPADHLLAVSVASLPLANAGQLLLDEMPVTAGQFIPATAIAGGRFLYQPPANATGIGKASFTFQVRDDGGTASGGVDLDPVPKPLTVKINHAPMAADDTYTFYIALPCQTTLTVNAPGVLINDGDTDGDPLTVELVDRSWLDGDFALHSDGSFVYTPRYGTSGAQIFTYRATDGTGFSQEATVTIQVTTLYGPFGLTVQDHYDVAEDVQLTVPAPGVLLNDTGNLCFPGTPVTWMSQGTHGVPIWKPDGSFIYIPQPNFNGTDVFTYTVGEGINSALGTVSINVKPVNDPPDFTKGIGRRATDEDGPTTVPSWATSLTAGPADEAAQQVHFILAVDKPELFAVQPAIDASGTLTFQPRPNASGTAAIAVSLVDDGGTANGGSDTSLPQTLVIDIAKPHAWHNAALPCDVDQDTFIAPGDALAVINYINSVGSGPIVKDAALGDFYYDVDGDQFVAPGDALMVINFINAHPSQGGSLAGEGEAAVDAGLLLYLLEDAPDSLRRKASG